MYANCRNFRVIKEIGVEEHDDGVRFFTGSGNTAISRMRSASGHNNWNSSFIMEVAMGQIPRSTVRISICLIIFVCDFYVFVTCCVGCCGRMRNAVKTFIDSAQYQRAVLAAILINTLSMGIEYHNQVMRFLLLTCNFISLLS